MAYFDPNKVYQDLNKEYNQMITDMNKQMDDLRKDSQDLLEQVRKMKSNLTWGAWEPYTIKLFPKRIKGKWYWKGATVYRRERVGPGGVHYQYGDDFDVLKDTM